MGPILWYNLCSPGDQTEVPLQLKLYFAPESTFSVNRLHKNVCLKLCYWEIRLKTNIFEKKQKQNQKLPITAYPWRVHELYVLKTNVLQSQIALILFNPLISQMYLIMGSFLSSVTCYIFQA